MPRYWVIAPYHVDRPEIWEKVWQFNLENSLISIGWKELEDIADYNNIEELKTAIERAYVDKTPASRTRTVNMLWNFYHNIRTGDIVVARKGRKRIAAIGTVTNTAYYSHAKNIEASGTDNYYSNHIDVRWHKTPRDKEFDRIVFGMQTLYEIDETRYEELAREPENIEDIKQRAEFVLEKYLEDFIVSNFDVIFGGQLALYNDPKENVVGQQYETGEVGRIDILAQESDSDNFTVIELKKGRESDKVLGQILRYMGWVSKNLCLQDGQSVKGMIICRDNDARLDYALKVTENVSVKYYRVDFELSDEPSKR